MPVLKTKAHDERKELDFEIEYQLSLTFQERYRMMAEASEYILKILRSNEKGRPFQIIKRK